MTYYHTQVLRLQEDLYSNDHLCKQIIRSKHFIDHHFSADIQLEDMATEAFFSKFHFIRLFKKMYGTTPYQYLITVRIAHAKKLLQRGMTISEVCFSIGFDSVTTFTGLFRRMTGYTPFAFQQKK